MKISVIPDSARHLGNRLFEVTNDRDDVLAPYRALKKTATARGWSMATFDRLPFRKANKVLAFNFAAFPEAVLEAFEAVGRAGMVAVVQEPPGIGPHYYDQDIQSVFGSFLVVATTKRENNNLFYLDFPVSPIHVDWVPFDQKKELVSVTSGKFSSFKGSLYKERIKAIKYFQSRIPNGFDMFGQGWQKEGVFNKISPHKLFSCYKGTIVSKHAIMRKYKFSLCYENCCDVQGYITEKIFDSMMAGCVPIYLGAPDIKKYVPEACFVDRRVFASDGELAVYIGNISESEYQHYLEGIRKYMLSERYQHRLPENYAQRILSFLENEEAHTSKGSPVEGRRKLTVLSARKMVRIGNLPRKLEGIRILFSKNRNHDWVELFREIMIFAARKSRLRDIFIWFRIRMICS